MNYLLDWSAVNTVLLSTLLVAVVRFMIRQKEAINEMRQVMLGFEGQGGALKEIQLLRDRTYDLSEKIVQLSAAMQELTRTIEQRRNRRIP